MNKPIVFYTGIAVPFGERVMCKPVNHPNHLEGHMVTNKQDVITSPVIKWDGRSFETENTIYKPMEET